MSILHETRTVARSLLRSPGYVAATLLILALGIGANAAIFSIVHAVLLRPLPYPDAERIVRVWETYSRGKGRGTVSIQNLDDWREQADAFEAMASYWPANRNLMRGDEPERVAAYEVSDPARSLERSESLTVTAIGAQPELFETLGVPLLAGEVYSIAETARLDPPGALVNRALAERLWPGEEAVGNRLRFGGGPEAPVLTVTGVVPDLIYEELTEQSARSRLQLFVPYERMPWRNSALIVRSNGAPATLAAPIRALLAELEPDAPVYDVMTMPARLSRTFEDRRLAAQLVGLFAVQGLALAAVGVFAMLAHAVARRRRAFGIRAALGASPRAIGREVARDGLRLATWGAAAGLALALAGGRALRGVVYGIDPLAFEPLAGSTLLLVAVASVACLIPAARAARLDPAQTLRQD